MRSETKTLLINILRWAVFFPASVAGAILGSWLFRVISQISLSLSGYADPDSWLTKAWLFYAWNLIFGAAFVYIAATIVPRGKAIVGTIMAAIILLLTGAILLPSLRARQWIDLASVIITNIGSIAVCIDVWRRDIQQHKTEDSAVHLLSTRL